MDAKLVLLGQALDILLTMEAGIRTIDLSYSCEILPPVTATAPNPVLQEAEREAAKQQDLLEIARASLRADAVLRRMEQDVLAQRRRKQEPERFDTGL